MLKETQILVLTCVKDARSALLQGWAGQAAGGSSSWQRDRGGSGRLQQGAGQRRPGWAAVHLGLQAAEAAGGGWGGEWGGLHGPPPCHLPGGPGWRRSGAQNVSISTLVHLLLHLFLTHLRLWLTQASRWHEKMIEGVGRLYLGPLLSLMSNE